VQFAAKSFLQDYLELIAIVVVCSLHLNLRHDSPEPPAIELSFGGVQQ
jgi:hypothetical protein